MTLVAASALSVTALAAPTAIRVDRDQNTTAASQAAANNPISVDASQATGQIQVTYQDANGQTQTATISAVAAQSETFARINAGGDALRVRQGPGTGYEILCKVYDGDRFPITGKTNGWYQILCNGRTGYVSADYVIVQDSSDLTKPDGNGSSNGAVVNPQGQQIVEFALQYVGYPYVYGTAGPNTFDCSGFTSYVFKNTVGSIPRVAQAQYDATTRVSRDDLLPGDLVFFGSSTSSISHVGIYVGSNQFIHAPSTGDVVKYSSLTGSYATRYQGAGRVIFE